MHESLPMDLPVEFIDVVPFNPLISKCKIKVCYVSDEPNRNKSIITKEVARKMANSLPGSPIVGHYSEEEKDFDEHTRVFEFKDGEWVMRDGTRPYGFVDLGAKAWFQKFLDDGTAEREYLVTEGYLWTGQYPESKRIIEKGNNQSMELDEDTLDGNWSKNNNNGNKFFIINDAIISKLCVLGENKEPCFEGSQVTKFSLGDDFKAQMISMMEQIKELLEKEGGQPVENEFIEVVETTEEAPVEETPIAEVEETPITVEEKEVVIEVEETVEVEVEFADNEDEICPECGKPEEECTCEKDKKQEYKLEEIQEYMDLKVEFEALQLNYNSVSTELNELKTEYSKLLEFKNTVDREKKQEMIDSFYMLSDEDKKDVVDNIDTYSLDDIEAKLSIICVRNKVSFNLDEETDAPSNYSYNVSYEEASRAEIPAWLRAADAVAKEMN